MSEHDNKPAEARVQRRLSAVFSADVQGYSRLMGDDEEATVRTLTAYRDVLSDHIVRHHGRVVDSPGDNLLAEFASAVDAVRCATEIQSELADRNEGLLDHRAMHFRIGINVGDVLVEGERIYGDGVNIAARIESVADGGGVCISSTVYDQVDGKLELGFEDIGEHALKNIERPIRVYRVLRDGDAQPAQTSRVTPAVAPETKSDTPSIAVLPFQNLSTDAEQAYFSDGITEDLITDLSKISGLVVISRNSVFTYKGASVRAEEVGVALGVRYVVEGSVRKAGNRVRISAQLIDATTDYHLWAERYDRQLDDIFAVQDEVVHEIANALAVTLTAGEEARVGSAPTGNLAAYDAFVRGREQFLRRERETNIEARRLFEQAIELDPNYAEAHAFLGRTFLIEIVTQWSDAPDLLDRVVSHGERAVALDESQPTAHETLAYAYLALREHDHALEEARLAIRFDPNFADAYVSLAEILNFAGQPAEALPLVERAMRLNPRYTPNYLWARGQAYWLLNDYSQAIESFTRVTARNPDHLVGHLMLAIVYAETGQLDEARREAAEVRRISPDFSAERSFSRVPYRSEADRARAYEGMQRSGLSTLNN